MLIEKKLEVNDVVSIRLATGEEIIGVLSATTETTVTLNKPCQVGVEMVSDKRAEIQFGPIAVSIENGGKVTFYNSSLLFAPVKSKSDIKAAYLKMTSPLEIPASASGLLLPVSR